MRASSSWFWSWSRSAPCPSLALAAALALAACSASPPVTTLKSVQVVFDVNANQNSATALDLVFAYDTTATGMLPKSGPDWFAKKDALMAGLATSIDVVTVQQPPATVVNPVLPPRYKKAIGVYSFANYIGSSGQPVGNLTPYKTVVIRVTADTIIYTGAN